MIYPLIFTMNEVSYTLSFFLLFSNMVPTTIIEYRLAQSDIADTNSPFIVSACCATCLADCDAGVKNIMYSGNAQRSA